MKKKSKSSLHSHTKHKIHKHEHTSDLSLEKTELPRISHKRPRKKHMVIIAVLVVLILASVSVLLFLGVIPTEEVTQQKAIETVSQNAATVNGEAITLEEVNTGYDNLDPTIKQQVSKLDFVNLTIIPQKLMLQAAIKEGHSVTPEEIDNEYQSFMNASGLDEAQIEANLNEAGVEKSELTEAIKNRLLLMKFLDNRLKGIAATEQEIMDVYQQNEAQIKANYGENATIQQLAPLIQQNIIMEKQQRAVLSLVSELRNNADISINKESLKA